MKYDHLDKATTLLYSYNRNLFVSSDPNREDTFYLCLLIDKASKQYKNLARIYRLKNDWYIWYENKCFRERINSEKPLTTALTILEKEFQKCVV